MESKSPYFSPKKTRNYVKQSGLKATLLQKAVQAREVTPEPVTSSSGNEKLVPSIPQIKIEPLDDDPPEKKPRGAPRRKPKVKVESSPDRQGGGPEVATHKSPRKRTPIKEEWIEGWEPVNWRQMLENIRQMRLERPAPVDSMGCDQFRDDPSVPAKTRRFHTLVSLMLSSQTKDQANFECMQRLRKHGLTPEQMLATDVEALEKLIYPVSFYKNKAKFIRQTSAILLSTYGGDIPDTIEGLMKLPGVGAKMAHLCMGAAWNVVTGIGVDTHVHRISNWLGWVPRETRTPEETRVLLERWLPFELWEEVNHLMVGFGQTVCTSTYPRCNECANAEICPARGKHGIRRTPVKKEIKQEELEF
uniref:Endonuclease III homolog n=1 Tax=Culex tarsalis TaxID=7177 RepID=A0A1Q3F4Q9_CULTA